MFCRAKKKLPLYTLANERLKELFLNKYFTVLSPTASTQLFKYLVSQSIRWELFLGTAKHPFVTNCLGMVRSPQNCRSISGRHNRLTSFLSSSVLIFMLLRFHEILMLYTWRKTWSSFILLLKKGNRIFRHGCRTFDTFWVPDDIESCNFQNLLVFGFPETSQNLMSFRQLLFSLFHGEKIWKP